MNLNLKDKRIILASKSPRRQELLKGLDLDFEVQLKDIDESYPNTMAAIDVPAYLAEKKQMPFAINSTNPPLSLLLIPLSFVRMKF